MNNKNYNPYLCLEKASAQKPDKTLLIYGDKKYSAKQVLEMIDKLTYHLKNQNITYYSKVAYSAKNHPLLLLLHVCLSRLGAITVPINPNLSANEKKLILKQTKIDLHIDNQNLEKYFNLCFKIPDNKYANEKIIPHTIDDDTIAAILFTSGSSAKPKGVKLTHKNLWWGSKNLRLGFKYTYDDHALVVAPLSHIGGFNGCTLDLFINAGTITIAKSTDPLEILESIVKNHITLMFAVPTVYEKIVSAYSSLKFKIDLSCLRLPLTGGAPVSESIIEKTRNIGLRLLPVWGMTEISASGAYLCQNLVGIKPANIGLPFEYTKIKILDLENMKEIKENNKIGQIAVSGPNVSSGYLNLPVNDKENYYKGMLLTKDLGCWFEDNFIQITGRKSDIIITGGEHVFPAEIDDIIGSKKLNEILSNLGFPIITLNKTFSVEDKYWGEKIICALVLSSSSSEENITTNNNTINNSNINYNSYVCDKESATSKDALYYYIKKYLKDKLSYYKIPKDILLLNDMPLRPNGKIDTAKLKQIYNNLKN